MKLKILNGEKDYDKLSHLPFNRDFKLRKSLVESMQKHGFIQPIILCWCTAINGIRELYILDGQHRALAASFLNIPFYSIILDEEPTTLEEVVRLVAKLNNSSVAWTLEDYCKAWRSLQNKQYTELLIIHKKYGYTLPTVASMLSGNLSRMGINVGESIKQGTFKIVAKDNTIKTLNYTRDIMPMSSRMLTAFHKLRLTHDNFVFEKFKLKFEKNYTHLKASGLDTYYDVFLTFL